HYAVRERGYLFLGRSESLLARSRWFTPHNVKWRVFQRTTTSAPTVAMALLRGGAPEVTAASAPGRAVDVQPAAARLQRVLETLPSALLVIDMVDTLLVWNAAAENLFDIPGENAIGRKFRDLDISYRVEGLRARIEEVKSAHIPARLDHVTFTRRSGELVHAEVTIIPMMEDNRVSAVVVYAADATESARLKHHLTHLAQHH